MVTSVQHDQWRVINDMKPYVKPLITEVKLEDQEVASMANSCKQAPDPDPTAPLSACVDADLLTPLRSFGS